MVSIYKIILKMGKLTKDRRDIYYRKAKEMGFRARSAFKLLQIDEEFNLFRPGKAVRRSLCGARELEPVVSRRLKLSSEDDGGQGEVRAVAVDLQEMAPIEGIVQLQGDITSEDTAKKIISYFKGEKADLVICDGAPDVTGMHDIDEYVQSQLLLAGLNITTFVLAPGGSFVAKIFRGKCAKFLSMRSSAFFDRVTCCKPKSSRNSSVEAFVVCEGFQLPTGYVPTMISPMCEEDSMRNAMARSKMGEHGSSVSSSGDLSGYDADTSYPLSVSFGDKKSESAASSYAYLPPTQAPINPQYSTYMKLRKDDSSK